MSRLTKNVQNILVIAAGLGAAWVFASYGLPGLVNFVKQDPLAEMRVPGKDDLPSAIGIELKGVKLAHFTGDKLTTAYRVDEIDIQQNRQIYELRSVTDGRFISNKGEFRFASEDGNWNGFSQILTCRKKVTISNSNLNLKSENLTFDNRAHVIRSNTPVSGRAFGGDLKMMDLVYAMDEDSMESTYSEWTGKIPKEFAQDAPEASGSKTWNVKMKRQKVKGDLWEGEDGYCSDGDIIVKAPEKINYDRKNEVVTAVGNVSYFSGKTNMIADKVVIYRKEKRALLIGNVHMLVKPKKDSDLPVKEEVIPPFKPLVPEEVAASRPSDPVTDPAADSVKKTADQLRDSKTVRDYPMVITAGQIEYWYKKGERRAKITGAPQGRQELPEGQWRYVWAHTAFYDGEKERLKLDCTPGKDDARMKNSIGDDLFARWFDLSTKEGDDDFESEAMHGKMRDTSDDDEKPDSGKPKQGDPPKKIPPKGFQGPIGRG